MKLEYTKEKLTFPYFQVWYSYKASANKTLLDSAKEMSGFRLSWRIEKSVGEGLLPANAQNMTEESTVEPKKTSQISKYNKNDYFSKLVQVAGQMRMKNMTRREMLRETIRKKFLNTTFPQSTWCQG